MKYAIIALSGLLVSAVPAHAALLGESDAAISVQAVSVKATGSLQASVNASASSSAGGASVRGNATSSLRASSTPARPDTASSSPPAQASAVAIAASEIRGWDAGEKEVFLMTVKSQAEVHSGQDLENFAKGVLLKDSQIESIDVSESRVEVGYKVPARFLGIFNTKIVAEVSVDAAAGSDDRVSVKFPWMRFLFNLKDEVKKDAIESAVAAELAASGSIAASVEGQAKALQAVSAVLKAKYEMAAGGEVGAE